MGNGTAAQEGGWHGTTGSLRPLALRSVQWQGTGTRHGTDEGDGDRCGYGKGEAQATGGFTGGGPMAPQTEEGGRCTEGGRGGIRRRALGSEREGSGVAGIGGDGALGSRGHSDPGKEAAMFAGIGGDGFGPYLWTEGDGGTGAGWHGRGDTTVGGLLGGTVEADGRPGWLEAGSGEAGGGSLLAVHGSHRGPVVLGVDRLISGPRRRRWSDLRTAGPAGLPESTMAPVDLGKKTVRRASVGFEMKSRTLWILTQRERGRGDFSFGLSVMGFSGGVLFWKREREKEIEIGRKKGLREDKDHKSI